MNKPATSTVAVSTEDLVAMNLFAGESAEALAWLIPYCSRIKLVANSIIVDPNTQNTSLYFILHGRAEVQLDSQGNQAISYLEVGQCIGEMSIIEGSSPSARVVTAEACTLIRIQGEILWKIIDRSHAVAKNLIHMLSSRVRSDNNAIIESRQLQYLHEQKSKIDGLTNLYNRRWLDEMLPRIFERYQTQQTAFSIIMLDVDHFKRYNDTHGHVAGDEALRGVAASISEHIRPNDMAARYGGEEFIVMLPNTKLEEAGIIAQRLRTAIKQQKISNEQFNDLPSVTASFGVATMHHKLTLAELISNADVGLYHAKKKGRDCIYIEH